MKALVTGATGSIGANLVDELLRRGYQVRAFVRPTSDLRQLTGREIELAEGDVTDAKSVRSAVKGCEWVFHTAALYSYSWESADEILDVACTGTENVLKEASSAGVARVTLTSSSVTVGYNDGPEVLDGRSTAGSLETESPYVVSKVKQERLAQDLAEKLGIDLVTVCPTMSVGPYGSHLGPSNATIVTYLADPLRLTYPGGCNIVAVGDVATGHILVAEKGTAGERYLLGSENLEWHQVHTIVSELCGVAPPYVMASHAACLAAAAGEEIWAKWEKRQPTTTRQQALMLGRYYWYSHAKAQAIGYRPRSARRALSEAVAWLAASPHISRELRSRLTLSREVYEARTSLELG